MSVIHAIRDRIRGMDLFELCLTVSLIIHGAGCIAYLISVLPGFSDDEKIFDAAAMKLKDVEVDFIEMPPSILMGGDTNPAPVQKEEWIEGTGTDRPDADNVDVDINRLSGDGTDEDGYMYADLSDRPPIPIIDFDLNRYFPQAARTANITRRTVLLRIQVNSDGSVQSARIISPPSGYGFDEAAMKVMQKIRFRPGKIGGKPVKMVMQIPITFVLEN
ncbi:MAG: energy transducer TonB [Spirochaetes bacterium]|nr:energy transducer TonB [Spirochaetota bacterium]